MSHNQRMFGLLILLALLLSACQPIVAQPVGPPSDEEVVTAVNEIWDEYEASQMTSDPDRWIALWTEDGVKMPPNGPALEGIEPIYARVQRGMTNAPTDEMVITPLEIQSAGDWAYSRGNFTVTYTIADTGVQEFMDGKFMTILQRQPDGTWKIHRDIHNSNVPPAPAAAEETDIAAITEAVLTTWDEYVESTLTNDVERRLELWADDGVILRPGRPPVEGKEAIYERVEGSFSRTTYEDMNIDNVEVEVSGDMAFARGTYTVDAVANESGEPIFVDGTYMSIFKQQADGTWKLYRDMTHSNMPPTPPTDVNTVSEAVDAIWREYEASLLDGDADRWIMQWMEDGVQMPPETLPRVGKETIYDAVSGFLEEYEYTHFVIENEDVEVNGDLAFARGTYEATFAAKDGGESMTVEGKYMTILRQQADGSWKIYRDIFNSNVPANAAATDIAALSAELHQRFSENDLKGAAELADENIKMIGYGLGLNFEGRDQFLKFMQARKRAFPNITLEHINLVVQGDQVVVEFIATGTHDGILATPSGDIEPTGRPITLHVVELHTWKDGKLVNLVQYQDPTSPLRQIGAME